MENGIAISPNEDKLIKLARKIPIEKQVSWLTLADAKWTITEILQKKELELQSKLLNYESMSLLELQTSLDEYKKGVTEMVSTRKGFTRYMDQITNEMMIPEKRAQDWDVFEKANKRRIELAQETENKKQKEAEKENEKALFIAHIKNEWNRVFTQYKIDLGRAIVEYYKNALGNDLDENGIKSFLDTAYLALGDIKPGQLVGFVPKMLTREEMMEINNKEKQPDWDGELQSAKDALKKRFEFYHNDKAKSLEAITVFQKSAEQAEALLIQESKQIEATNNLLAQATAHVIPEHDGIKPLKKKESIVIEERADFAVKIISAFLANFSKAMLFVRVRKLSNLSIAQMAAALDEANIKIDGVQYTEIVK